MARLNAEVDDATRRALYHALLDDGLTFSMWLRQQIDAYLAAREKRSRDAAADPPSRKRSHRKEV